MSLNILMFFTKKWGGGVAAAPVINEKLEENHPEMI